MGGARTCVCRHEGSLYVSTFIFDGNSTYRGAVLRYDDVDSYALAGKVGPTLLLRAVARRCTDGECARSLPAAVPARFLHAVSHVKPWWTSWHRTVSLTAALGIQHGGAVGRGTQSHPVRVGPCTAQAYDKEPVVVTDQLPVASDHSQRYMALGPVGAALRVRTLQAHTATCSLPHTRSHLVTTLGNAVPCALLHVVSCAEPLTALFWPCRL